MVLVVFICFLVAYDGSEWLGSWVRTRLATSGDTYIQASWLTLVSVKNHGTAFGLLDRWPAVLVLGVGLDVVLIALIARWSRESRLLFPALGLILGGATSNFVDRVRLGYVVDVIQIDQRHATNPADIAMTLGMILLLAALARCAWTRHALVHDYSSIDVVDQTRSIRRERTSH